MIVFFVNFFSFIVNKEIVDEFNYLRNKFFKTRIKHASLSIITIINIIFCRKRFVLKIKRVNFK